jgi:hypothetical protein
MARPAAATPQVDGQLDEPSWKTAAALTGFATTTGAPPAFATTGMLLHDRNGLFLGLSCDDEDTALLTDQDTIEVLLTRMPNAKPAFRLTLSPTGRVQWRRILADGKDAPWAVSGIQFATEKTKRAWTLELFVPFAAMGMRPPSAPERWFVRVTRTKATGTKETSVWAPVPSDNRPSPPGFGEVILTPIALPPSGPPLQSEAAPQPAPEPAPAPEPDQDAMP